MAHSLSAKKRIRQNEKRRARNRARRATLKTRIRQVRETLAQGAVEPAVEALRVATKALDRASSRGTLHKNAAARRKSRLAKKVNALKGRGTKAAAAKPAG